VVDLTSILHIFEEHPGLGSTCLGKVLPQNRHGPLYWNYVVLDRHYQTTDVKVNLIQIIGQQLFCPRVSRFYRRGRKMEDSPIKSDTKLGPKTDIGAESQSEGAIQLVPIP